MNIVQLRVMKKCYYDGRVRTIGSIIDFNMDHRGRAKDGTKTKMPSWGELVVGQDPAEADPVKTEFKETTLHALAESPGPKVRRANTGKKVGSKSKNNK